MEEKKAGYAVWQPFNSAEVFDTTNELTRKRSRLRTNYPDLRVWAAGQQCLLISALGH